MTAVQYDLRDGPALPSACLAVVREMLESFERLTVAGQQYTMRKIIACLQSQAKVTHDASPRNQRVLDELLASLTAEAAHALPDVHTFARRAENLMVLLAAIE